MVPNGVRRAGRACVLAGLLAGPATAGGCPDLALVLAIDASGSVDTSEFVLQTGGIAAALADPRVGRAIERAGDVWMAAVIWGDSAFKPQIVAWHAVASDTGREAFARRVAGQPRRVFGDTDIGPALDTALDLIEAGAGCALRQVINVSGDGRETSSVRGSRIGASLTRARQRAEASGVVVNGLAIINEEPDLAEWYAARLVTGPGAFVMVIDDYRDFAEAMTTKLEREIAPPLLSLLDAGTQPHRD